MICQTCGSQIPDGNAFCPICGSSTSLPYQTQPQPPKKNNTALIAVIALAAVLLIAVIVLVVVLLTRDTGSSGSQSDRDDTRTEEKDTNKDTDDTKSQEEDVVETFLVALFKNDASTMADQVPNALLEAAVEVGDYDSVSQAKRSIKSDLQDIADAFYDEVDILYGADPDDVKVKVSGIKKDRTETNYLKDEVVDAYADTYDVTVKDFAAYTCTLTVTVDGDKDTFDDFYVPLVKIGSGWYIDIYSLNDELFEPFI